MIFTANRKVKITPFEEKIVNVDFSKNQINKQERDKYELIIYKIIEEFLVPASRSLFEHEVEKGNHPAVLMQSCFDATNLLDDQIFKNEIYDVGEEPLRDNICEDDFASYLIEVKEDSSESDEMFKDLVISLSVVDHSDYPKRISKLSVYHLITEEDGLVTCRPNISFDIYEDRGKPFFCRFAEISFEIRNENDINHVRINLQNILTILKSK